MQGDEDKNWVPLPASGRDGRGGRGCVPWRLSQQCYGHIAETRGQFGKTKGSSRVKSGKHEGQETFWEHLQVLFDQL